VPVTQAGVSLQYWEMVHQDIWHFFYDDGMGFLNSYFTSIQKADARYVIFTYHRKANTILMR
jgi:hypothetical protein